MPNQFAVGQWISSAVSSVAKRAGVPKTRRGSAMDLGTEEVWFSADRRDRESERVRRKRHSSPRVYRSIYCDRSRRLANIV
eukprot:1367086-Lingulodinium_polyedra.AAC.1